MWTADDIVKYLDGDHDIRGNVTNIYWIDG